MLSDNWPLIMEKQSVEIRIWESEVLGAFWEPHSSTEGGRCWILSSLGESDN